MKVWEVGARLKHTGRLEDDYLDESVRLDLRRRTDLRQARAGAGAPTEHVLPSGGCRQFGYLPRLDSRLKGPRGCV
jgi:hypothetical protein